MISDTYWKMLEEANCILTSSFSALKSIRAAGDEKQIKMAEMKYFQALQSIMVTTQNAIAEKGYLSRRNNKIE